MASPDIQTLLAQMRAWRRTLSAEQRWCIMISADPDALASAMALKRIMHPRARRVDIVRINEVTRPDNLAMIRFLRIPVKPLQPERLSGYTNFAIVDSQPSHNRAYEGIRFDLIIDHHPPREIPPVPPAEPAPETAGDAGAASGAASGADGTPPAPEPPAVLDIRPGFGATSTIMTRYLQALRIRPGALLATALLYGIRTDTATFERSGGAEDLRAYQWLFPQADNGTLRRIIRSEYLRPWLRLFNRAFRSLQDCRGGGVLSWMGDTDSADLLVAVADFFTRVHGLKWIAVAGAVGKTVVVIFRGDGSRDIGRLADASFHDVGSAGGHRTLGRAEFPLSAIPAGLKPADFLKDRLERRKLRRPRPAPENPAAAESGVPAAERETPARAESGACKNGGDPA